LLFIRENELKEAMAKEEEKRISMKKNKKSPRKRIV